MKAWPYAIGWVFLAAFTLLLTAILRLVCQLKRKSMASRQSNLFKKEICKLYSILTMFSAAYLFRAYFDITIEKRVFNVKFLALYAVYNLIWDFAPVMMLLVFHARNFGSNLIGQ